jgi:hypothetical protein
MALPNGRYAHCFECDTYTPIADDADEGECGRCMEDIEKDPWCTEVVDIIDCPRTELRDNGECASDEHHWGLHEQHAVTVER